MQTINQIANLEFSEISRTRNQNEIFCDNLGPLHDHFGKFYDIRQRASKSKISVSPGAKS